MSEFASERQKPWNIYTSSDPSPPSEAGVPREAPAKGFGTSTSMSAISFGFVATVILISMFLIMAIFEHLFRPTSSFSTHQDSIDEHLESGSLQKPRNSCGEPPHTLSNFSVLMPGERNPTYIAQPAPLPSIREGIYWPSHDCNFVATNSISAIVDSCLHIEP